MVPIPEPCSRFGEETEADVPFLVEREVGETVHGQRVQLDASLIDRAKLGQHVRQNAAPDRIGGVVFRGTADKLVDLFDPPLLTAKDVELKSVVNGCVPALTALAEGTRLADQLLGLSEPSLEQRQNRSQDGG